MWQIQLGYQLSLTEKGYISQLLSSGMIGDLLRGNHPHQEDTSPVPRRNELLLSVRTAASKFCYSSATAFNRVRLRY